MNYAPSRAQVRKIKTLQGLVFGDDDAAYREMLQGQAGVKSCKDLRGPKIDRVIRHLERCAGQVKKEQPGYIGEIKRRWARVSRVAQEWGAESRQSIQALNKFVFRVAGVAAVEWLTLPQGQKVIEALKAMGGRRKAMG